MTSFVLMLYLTAASDGRMAVRVRQLEESPGSHGDTVPDTSGGGDPGKAPQKKTASAQVAKTAAARVKRCGKSAPRGGNGRGTASPPGARPNRTASACFRAAVRVGRARRPATASQRNGHPQRKPRTEPVTGHLTHYSSPPPGRGFGRGAFPPHAATDLVQSGQTSDIEKSHSPSECAHNSLAPTKWGRGLGRGGGGHKTNLKRSRKRKPLQMHAR